MLPLIRVAYESAQIQMWFDGAIDGAVVDQDDFGDAGPQPGVNGSFEYLGVLAERWRDHGGLLPMVVLNRAIEGGEEAPSDPDAPGYDAQEERRGF